MSEALKPCPFCGDKMKPWGHEEVIHANGDGCIIGKNGFFAAAWNTRVDIAEAKAADLQAKLTECCLQALATDGQAAEALDRAVTAEAEAANLRAKLAEALAERDEALRLSGAGCYANDGGYHTVITQGRYKFCAKCGETLVGVRFCHLPPAKDDTP